LALLILVVLTCLNGARTSMPAAEPERLDVEIIPDVAYDHKYALAMTFDVLKPRKNANGAGILVILSGGWHSTWSYPETALADRYQGWFDSRPLLAKGYTIFLVRHGSCEKFTLPEIVDDVRRAVRFIRSNPTRFGVDPERLGAVGCSSGGHLALMLANGSDEGVPNPRNWDGLLRFSDRIATAVAYYPPTDIRPWFKNGRWKDFSAFKFDPELAGLYSPLVLANFRSAPTLLLHGDKDPVVPIEHSQNLQAACKKLGVPCELVTFNGAGHGFAGDGGQPTGDDARLAAEARNAWFDKWLAKPAPKAEVKPPPEVKAPAEAAIKLAAQYAVADLSAGAAGPWPVTELDKVPDDLLKDDAWRTNKILLRRISAGKFVMGSPATDAAAEQYAYWYHAPDKQHTVTLAKAFYVAVFPTTQEQWSRVMGSNPSYFSGNPKRPVETVSWNDIRGGNWPVGQVDAKSFIGRLRKGSSQPFDLPTEAQWECACRAGTTRALNNPTASKGEGDDCSDAALDKIAWFEGNSERQTHDVGLKLPNAWGLYDMCGNVSQWCLDFMGDYPGNATDPTGPVLEKTQSGRVARGGYWSMPATGCRSSARNCDASAPQCRDDVRYNVCGFRLALPAGQ
jgi:formylglycine-generating enzyme required for sulfatase activity/acetyl esterase/lipase